MEYSYKLTLQVFEVGRDRISWRYASRFFILPMKEALIGGGEGGWPRDLRCACLAPRASPPCSAWYSVVAGVRGRDGMWGGWKKSARSNLTLIKARGALISISVSYNRGAEIRPKSLGSKRRATIRKYKFHHLQNHLPSSKSRLTPRLRPPPRVSLPCRRRSRLYPPS